jgi:cytidine deaminase
MTMVTEQQKTALVETAYQVREMAYAPYSNFKVGAAILTADGRIFGGANVENASYGLSICAERSAVFSAVTAGVKRILAVAVCTENGVSPCGACRQVLGEFAGDIPVWLCDTEGNVSQTSLQTLLPDHFGPEDLPE